MSTYTQLHIHFVFAVKFRRASLHKSWRSDLFKYMAGIARNHGHKVLAINGVDDHVHVFVGLSTEQSVSSFMHVLKKDSSAWINEQHFCKELFRWQEGYGAFACCRSQMDRVVKYVLNQEAHHAAQTLRDEQITLLRENEIRYHDKYLFHEPL